MENKGEFKKVSIILPTHNRERYIRETIDSCLGQTYSNLELIIIDDASSDEIFQIVNSYSDKRIKYLRNETNLGLSKTLNRGFTISSGEYLTWQSDDNFYGPKAIATMVEALEKKQKIDFVYANFYVVDEKGEIIRRGKIASPKILDRYNCIGPCFLYRRIVYDRLGEFDPRFYFAEDYEYWLRVKSQFRLQRLNKFLCYYRFHKNSLTFQHKTVEIEEQAGKASSKYLFSPSIRYYHKGKLLFYKKDYNGAKKILIKSLVYEPFNLDTWKLLIFVYLTVLSPALARKIKKIRN